MIPAFLIWRWEFPQTELRIALAPRKYYKTLLALRPVLQFRQSQWTSKAMHQVSWWNHPQLHLSTSSINLRSIDNLYTSSVAYQINKMVTVPEAIGSTSRINFSERAEIWILASISWLVWSTCFLHSSLINSPMLYVLSSSFHKYSCRILKSRSDGPSNSRLLIFLLLINQNQIHGKIFIY